MAEPEEERVFRLVVTGPIRRLEALARLGPRLRAGKLHLAILNPTSLIGAGDTVNLPAVARTLGPERIVRDMGVLTPHLFSICRRSPPTPREAVG